MKQTLRMYLLLWFCCRLQLKDANHHIYGLPQHIITPITYKWPHRKKFVFEIAVSRSHSSLSVHHFFSRVSFSVFVCVLVLIHLAADRGHTMLPLVVFLLCTAVSASAKGEWMTYSDFCYLLFSVCLFTWDVWRRADPLSYSLIKKLQHNLGPKQLSSKQQ